MKLIPRRPVETADVSRGKMDRRSAVKTVVSAALVLALVYLLLGWLGILLSSVIPDPWEKSMSGANSALKSDSQASLERPQRLLDRLIEGEKLRDLNYHLFWLDFDEPNPTKVVRLETASLSGWKPARSDKAACSIKLSLEMQGRLWGAQRARWLVRGSTGEAALDLHSAGPRAT